MNPAELLRYAAELLDRLGVMYFVTRSTATIAYGEPRFTNDIDIVIDLPIDRVADFCAGFASDEFYLNPDSVLQAAVARHQFNVLHPESGFKLDFIVISDSIFDKSRETRRRSLSVLPDRLIVFASPEDVILKKLCYYQEGGSDKHLRDIAGVLRVQGESVDRDYIGQWSDRLGVGGLWMQILEAERKT